MAEGSRERLVAHKNKRLLLGIATAVVAGLSQQALAQTSDPIRIGFLPALRR